LQLKVHVHTYLLAQKTCATVLKPQVHKPTPKCPAEATQNKTQPHLAMQQLDTHGVVAKKK
jgi:hypothetical protein